MGHTEGDTEGDTALEGVQEDDIDVLLVSDSDTDMDGLEGGEAETHVPFAPQAPGQQ